MVVVNGTLADKPRYEGRPYTGSPRSSWGKALEWSRRGWWGRPSHWLHPGTPDCKKVYTNKVKSNKRDNNWLHFRGRLTFAFWLFCLDPFRTIWQKWNDLWMQEWVSAWPGSRAPTAGHLLPAAGREPLTCFQVSVSCWSNHASS